MLLNQKSDLHHHPLHPARQPAASYGVALLITLLVITLLTIFIGELFFGSGLYLRKVTTIKALNQSRNGAMALLELVKTGLLQDEMKFFGLYQNMKARIKAKQFSWHEGAITELEIEPLDHRFNLNVLGKIRPEQDLGLVRWNLFWNVIRQIEAKQWEWRDEDSHPIALSNAAINDLYAAIVDWIDYDSVDYANGVTTTAGGEARAYFNRKPQLETKNAPLDSLRELMLVRGVVESGIPWHIWQRHFVVLPVIKTSGSEFNLEKINVNTASKQEIIDYLRARNFVQRFAAFNVQTLQKALKQYADRAPEIAEVLIPDETERETYDKEKLKKTLEQIGFSDNYGANELFSTHNTYYRVRIGVEVDSVTSRLETQIYVKRNEETRTGLKSIVLSLDWL